MALAPLSPLVVALVALGLAALLTILTLAAVQLLGQAPGIGPWIANKATAIEAHISHALGEAFSGIDAFIGGTIHSLARRVEHVANAIAGAAESAVAVAEALNPVAILAHGAGALAKAAENALHGIEHGVRSLDRELRGIEHGIRRIERDLTRGIGHDLRLEVASLDKELTHVERRVIPGIRSDVATAEGEIGNLYEWAKGKASLLGVGTFAYAVSVALGGLGLDWLSCRSRSSVAGLRNCGLWNALEDLLNFAAGALLFANVCEFLTFVSPFVSEIADTIIPALTDVGAGLCQGTIGPPPPLPAVTLYTPANPGVTLNLP